MTHDELIERVTRATGPDRDLDVALCLALNYIAYTPSPLNLRLSEDDDAKWLDYELVEDGKMVDCSDKAPELTGSIDATLALLDRRLKTYTLAISIDPSGNGAKLTWWPNGLSNLYDTVESDCAAISPPLAIILALLNAKKEITNVL